MLAATVAEASRRWGEAAAYVSPTGWRLSYAALDRLSDEVAGGLAARGVRAGDVVAVVLPPWPEFVVVYAAAAKLGAVTAGVNARLTPAERVACLDLGPALVVGGDGEPVEPATDDSDCLAGLRVSDYAPATLPADPERPVALVFTSGTTGTPKGAVFAGRQLETITAIDTGWSWGGGGPQLGTTTFAHLGPMTKLPGALVRGGTTHLLERWRAADAVELVARERMAAIGGIPTQLALMLADPAFEAHDLSCVQAVVIGGGPATPALVRSIRARFGAAVAVRYSCTEAGIGTGTAFTDPPEDAEVSVGRPQPGVELLVLDDDDRPVEPGDIGAVCLRSAATMSRYWVQPEATAAAHTADGAVRTGDRGWVDDAGRLRLAGREREMYVRGGENVFPAEVESVLATVPGVVDVAVVARPDDVWGEVGVAVVVPADRSSPPTLASLRDAAARALAPFKLPEDVVVVDVLPLTAMDKVDRRALNDLVSPSARRAAAARGTSSR
ncbi:MAG: class I adenylate-forming enzyme family protein [Acidimicrobiales bacterium]